VTTALGAITVARNYTWARDGGGAFRADAVLGLDGFLTRQAARLVVLAGVEHPFARAQQVLRAFCGWDVGAELIRRTTHAHARRAGAGRARRGDAVRFAAAPGAVELLIDAGKANTLDGWRDVKVGVLGKRELGSPATPDRWDERELPALGARAVCAAVEGCEAFGARLRAESDRLGVTGASDVTVLGDGAEWIWNVASEHWPGASGVLDVYHAVEHVGGAVAAVFGEGTDATARHTAAGRAALVGGGKSGAERWLCGLIAAVPTGRSTDPLLALGAYLAKHPTRLGYADRLASGRSIGSGAVEGAIKQLLNLRLKRTGARWRAEHVGPLVELRALAHTPEWHELWNAA